jgi:hypothetical protein
VISGDNDLSALEFQKHYRLPIVHLLDPSRIFGRTHNPNGWPFLMLADQQGRIVYKKNGLVTREERTIQELLDNMLKSQPEVKPITLDGVTYMPATLGRSGESRTPRRRERFSSLACGRDGKVYIVFTTNRNGNSDVFVRTFDGKTWSEDRPVAATAADEYDGMVLIDAQNRAWVSWTSNADGKNYNIFTTTLTDAPAPVKPVQVTHADDDAMHARMACDRNDNVYLTYYKWHKMGQWSRDKEVYARRWAGNTWSDEVRVSPTDVSEYEDHSDPAIAGCDRGAVICWSWDFHKPRGYTTQAEAATIFARRIDARLKLGKIAPVSGKQIDLTPALGVSDDEHIWCAWDSLGWEAGLRSYRKRLRIRQVTSEAQGGGTEGLKLSEAVANVCTPTFAVSPAGAMSLLWSQTSDGANWVLKRADFDPKRNEWSKPHAAESKGNPRYCSAGYDSSGELWVSYSVQTEKGREIAARKLPRTGP